MYNETITYYSKNPFNKFEMDDYDVEYYEENELCWDDLKVFLKIKDNIIENWSFAWDTAIITTACWWVYWESIIWMTLEEVLELVAQVFFLQGVLFSWFFTLKSKIV